MRNISFALTTPQFINRTKRVTRRLGWKKLSEGEHLMGCEKTMGFKPGEKIKRLGEIIVQDTRWEPLNCITPDDVIAEGFPHLTPEEFISFFCQHNKCEPTTPVNRILFEYNDQPELIELGPKTTQPKYVPLMFAANAENGTWSGECSDLQIGDLELELVTMNCDCGECDKGGDDHYDIVPALFIRKKSRSLEFWNMADTAYAFELRTKVHSYRRWVGNNQWDRCDVRADDLVRFINWMKWHRYATATSNVFDWWETDSTPITLDNLYEALNLEVE